MTAFDEADALPPWAEDPLMAQVTELNSQPTPADRARFTAGVATLGQLEEKHVKLTCPKHGLQIASIVHRVGSPWPTPICPKCKVEAEEAAREDEAMRGRLRFATKTLTELLDAAPTVENPCFTFDAFKPETPEEEHHLKACKAFAENFLERERARAAAFKAADPDWQTKNGLGLLLQGHYGTGKSHLAAAVKRTVDGLGIGAVIVSHAQLLNVVLEKKITVGELRRRAGSAPLLIIEELGAGVSDSDWNRSRLCEVIDSRVAAGRPTVFVTNLAPKELSAALGERISSRIRGSVYRLAFTGRDRRSKPAGDALNFFGG